MKFAAVLRDNAEELPDLADLFALYKQLKKSLKRIPNRGGDTDHSEASQDTQPTNGTQQQELRGEQAVQQQGTSEEAACKPADAATSEKSPPPHAARELEAGDDVAPAGAAADAAAGTTPHALLGVAGAGPTSDTAGRAPPSGLTPEQQLLLDEQEQAVAAASLHEVQEAYKAFVNFHGELLLLLHWSILAYTGLVKILKKHHKRTGLLLRAPHLENLLSQPFCSVEVTCDMVRRAEAQVNTLAKRLEVPPACPVQAAAGAAAAAAAAMAPGETVNSPFHRTPSDANLHSCGGAGAQGRAGRAGGGSVPPAGGSPPPAEAAAAACSPATAGSKRVAAEAGLEEGEGSQMMRRTRAALNVWQHLQVTAATPSTVLPSGHVPTQAAASGMTNQSAA